jgi:hypothetical protein
MRSSDVPSHGRCRISLIMSVDMSEDSSYDKNLRRATAARRDVTNSGHPDLSGDRQRQAAAMHPADALPAASSERGSPLPCPVSEKVSQSQRV